MKLPGPQSPDDADDERAGDHQRVHRQGEAEGHGDPLTELGGDVVVGGQRLAEVALEHPTQPVEVAHQERVVEVQLRPDRL